jgi:hypothetical protein
MKIVTNNSPIAMCTLKLASPKGTLLGSVTFPAFWLSYLNVSGVVEFSTVGDLGTVFRDHGVVGQVVLARGVLERSQHVPDAVVLSGMSLEEFERLPGCSFAPGAAYLRSVVA